MNKVVSLTAENIMRLRVVSLKLDGKHVVKITGKNGQGKSTLAGLFDMLRSTKAIPTDPIRHGADKGVISFEIETPKGIVTVTRTLTKSNQTGAIKIVAEDGSKIGSTEALVQELLGPASEDILYLYNLPDTKDGRREQVRIVAEALNLKLGEDFKSIVPYPFEITDDLQDTLANAMGAIDTEYKAWNKKADVAQHTVSKYADVSEVEVKDITALMQEKDEKAKENEKTLRLKDTVDRAKEDVTRQAAIVNNTKQDIANLQRQLETIQKQILATEERLEKEKQVGKDLLEKRDALIREYEKKSLIPLESYNAAIVAATENNKKHEQWLEKQKAQVEKNEADAKLKELKGMKVKVEEYKKKLVENAQFPIEGLSFDESGVLYNGVPIRQAGKGAAMKIGFALQLLKNPTTPFFRIDAGGELDEESEKIITFLAEKHDATVLIVKVDDQQRPAIVIEDGEVIDE